MAGGRVSEALRADLSGMSADVSGSALAALALAMAEQVDEKATAIMCAELAAIIRMLRELSPASPVADAMDDLEAKRARRRHLA